MFFFLGILFFYGALFYFILILYTKLTNFSTQKMAETEDDNPSDSLHKCIFEDDYRKLSQLIRTNDIAQKDKHGNTLGFY